MDYPTNIRRPRQRRHSSLIVRQDYLSQLDSSNWRDDNADQEEHHSSHYQVNPTGWIRAKDGEYRRRSRPRNRRYRRKPVQGSYYNNNDTNNNNNNTGNDNNDNNNKNNNRPKYKRRRNRAPDRGRKKGTGGKVWRPKANQPQVVETIQQDLPKEQPIVTPSLTETTQTSVKQQEPTTVTSNETKTSTEESKEPPTVPLKKLPVTVLSGFLGSGKTTLVEHILKNKKGLKVAVIVNDMSELNIDAQFIRADVELIQQEEKLIEMQNGCICCTLREDLLLEIKKLALANKFDYLVIESSGISEPLQVAETFTFGELATKKQDSHSAEDKKEEKEPQSATKTTREAMQILDDVARLDTLVTVIDAKNFEHYISSVQKLSEKYGKTTASSSSSDTKTVTINVPPEDERNVAHLLIDQIEFANVLLINKIDLVDNSSKLVTIEQLCQKLNPKAKVFKTNHATVALNEILNTNSFSFVEASQNPGWLKEIRGEHVPESQEYGITSWVYRARKPFHPMKLYMLTTGKQLKGILRAKGWFWLASKPDICFEWNQAGDMIDFEHGGNWFATLKESDWGVDEETKLKAKGDFEGEYGDRRQEIVVIGGKDMDIKQVKETLDFCLLTNEEMRLGPEKWKTDLQDPFELDFEDEDEDVEDDEDDEEEGDEQAVSDIE